VDLIEHRRARPSSARAMWPAGSGALQGRFSANGTGTGNGALLPPDNHGFPPEYELAYCNRLHDILCKRLRKVKAEICAIFLFFSLSGFCENSCGSLDSRPGSAISPKRPACMTGSRGSASGLVPFCFGECRSQLCNSGTASAEDPGSDEESRNSRSCSGGFRKVTNRARKARCNMPGLASNSF
jgi:hypothetical protein